MGRVVMTEFVSIDEVIEAPGGEEGDKIKLDEALDAAALLLGRVTYQGCAAAPGHPGLANSKTVGRPKTSGIR